MAQSKTLNIDKVIMLLVCSSFGNVWISNGHIVEISEKWNHLVMKVVLLFYRNKACLFFLLANTLFVTFVFTLQQISSQDGGALTKRLPCATDNYGEAIDPISISFTVVFGLLLVSMLKTIVINIRQNLNSSFLKCKANSSIWRNIYVGNPICVTGLIAE